jgi:L-rhamnose mutarotase
MSRRLCFALDLVDDPAKIAEYEQFHQPGRVWPQIVDDIHAQGIEDMEIWRTGDRMVMIATVADDYPRARDIPPEYDEWETLMWTFQKALPHAAPGQKWMPMTRIFDLARQKGATKSR